MLENRVRKLEENFKQQMKKQREDIREELFKWFEENFEKKFQGNFKNIETKLENLEHVYDDNTQQNIRLANNLQTNEIRLQAEIHEIRHMFLKLQSQRIECLKQFLKESDI